MPARVKTDVLHRFVHIGNNLDSEVQRKVLGEEIFLSSFHDVRGPAAEHRIGASIRVQHHVLRGERLG